MEGKQLFRQYDRAYGDAFLKLLKTIHSGSQNAICFWIRHRHTTGQGRLGSILMNIKKA